MAKPLLQVLGLLVALLGLLLIIFDNTGITGAVIGGVNQWATLRDGTPEEVRREVEDAADQTDGIGLIVGPGCVLPTGVPDENVVALVKALGGTVMMAL